MKSLRVVSLFSGIGAYERALSNIGIKVDLVKYCELDPVKSRAYALLHNVDESKNMFDVTKTKEFEVADFDLLVYSPPCQSFSVSGKKLGLDDIRGTLFFDSTEIIKRKQPKFCVMENVDNLARKFKDDFKLMLEKLDSLGYNNYWKIINAKDFIPQNRNRVYVVSIRKDIDDYSFEFPVGIDKRKWSDIVDLNDARELTNRQKRMVDYAMGVKTDDSITLEGDVQFENSVITLRQSGLRFQNNREYPAITAHYGKGGGNFTIIARDGVVGGITPRNCFKLMGFEFEDSELLTQNKFSVSSQYVMAGDSVCVPVLEEIFKKLFLNKEE